MNYSTDKPIDTCEQDLLGRASFSKQLGRAIYDYNGKDGLVIGSVSYTHLTLPTTSRV